MVSPELAAILSRTLMVAPTAGPGNPDGFMEAVTADLHAIYATPTGRQLLDSLHASGRKIYINYGPENRTGFPFNTDPALYRADGVTPGQGLAVVIEYTPFVENTGGLKDWNTRPPAIGLAHELIHAEQAAHGRMRREITENPGGLDKDNPHKLSEVGVYELEAVGVPPHDTYPFTENKIRSEWNPPQTRRTYY
ncbi:MAG: hypothetical protein EOO61_17065 [Hymenobacter sp.]|nr:MAG: hypothetical protein EOO61_17065 [Hymenobacter sp.]